eukprot:CAMPEP_0175973740 /NCGR_PEP_ID=MMETSP0108-20121206/42983_1 /TAXON_ID=195067 ORGANISM="Goniomonas pacifica, Strain CCMP1869" /NCGR_SAMPLE_ID=MMETSP0108 /ASSEMBLY_ACC=CAM_ASM_000204 /LENGTH=53 /DNA_ID=CAMNT_0017303263 /DNA_START=415 /DNA_END=572 /DNA_ORIENTATION=-
MEALRRPALTADLGRGGLRRLRWESIDAPNRAEDRSAVERGGGGGAMVGPGRG